MKTKNLTALLAATLCCLQPLCAQTTTAQASAPPGAVESFIQDAKYPVSWLTLGGDLRVRNEYFNNALTLSDDVVRHEQDVVRFRGRFWGSATLMTNLSLNARISAEPRLWMKDAFAGQYVGQEGMEWRFGLVDNLNVKWNNIGDTPLSLTIGRQDIMLGDFYDWWLMADGTPGDGSWSFFLDAARMTYDAKDIATKFDLAYVNQTSEPNDHFPTLNNSEAYYLTEQDEQGVIAYASNKSVKNTTLDGYFMYKNDRSREQFAGSSDADIYTFGGKVTGTPEEHWQYSLEGAYQFGSKNDLNFGRRDMDAFGGKGRLTYSLKDRYNNQLSLMGEYLSGDDPDTEDDEMFDLLWGRWPRWSELYIYSYPAETAGKIAQINNIWRVGAGWSFTPVKKLGFSTMYNALFAPEETPTRTASALFSRDGNFRGHYLQAIFKYQVSKYVSTHLWSEFVWEGDYYAQRDLMSFVRAEVMFSF